MDMELQQIVLMTRLREHLKQTLADIDEIFGTAPNVSQTPFDWDTIGGLTSMEPKLVADPQQQLTWPDGAVGGLDPDPKA